MSLRFLKTIDVGELDGARVLVRIDTNIPIGDDGVVDPDEAFRIDRILPTLSFLKEHGARLILIGHHGGKDDTQTLRPVADYLDDQGFPCRFIPGIISADLTLDAYPIVLFDNLRLNPGEKENGYDFACLLSSYADIYVNEAFSASHRKHASIVGVPEHLPGYLGLEHTQEIDALGSLRGNTQGLGIIVGGSKFETKIDLIRTFLHQGTPIFLGGALAHAIYCARGYEIGDSFIDSSVDVSDIAHNPLIIVPEHVLVLAHDGVSEKHVSTIHTTDVIVDMGESARDQLALFLSSLTTVLWNGPLGWYEKGYTKGTLVCAEEINTRTSLTSILGGGDTVALLNKEHLLGSFTFVSTGGGALLDYLLNGSLPGIDALND